MEDNCITELVKYSKISEAEKMDFITATEASKILKVDIKMITEHFIPLHNFPHKKKGSLIRIDFDSFVKWLKDNQDLWDSRKLDILALGYEYSWLKKKREKDKERPVRKYWTPYEISKVKLLIEHNLSVKKLAKELNRSESSVYHKRRQLLKDGNK